MSTYEILRHFADSWALLAMALVFLGIVVRVCRPGRADEYQELAAIAFKYDTDKDRQHG